MRKRQAPRTGVNAVGSSAIVADDGVAVGGIDGAQVRLEHGPKIVSYRLGQIGDVSEVSTEGQGRGLFAQAIEHRGSRQLRKGGCGELIDVLVGSFNNATHGRKA